MNTATPAALDPSRLVRLYCIDRDGNAVTRAQTLPADKAERLQIARNRAEQSARLPFAGSYGGPQTCDTGHRWATEEVAPLSPFNPETAEAARVACREAGKETPAAFGAAYRAHAETFAATAVCPGSAAYGAALEAARAA